MAAPDAPWTLAGECIGALARRPRGFEPPLPAGLARMPGPVLVVAVRYTGSPVGPYLELAVGTPARLGLRPGWCITTMVVSSADSRVGGRLQWGFPKELGTLRWHADGDERTLIWEERGVVVRGVVAGPPLPVLVPVRSLQRRADGPVVVPGRLWGRAQRARVDIAVDADDDLAALAGRHVGGVVSGMRFVVRPARTPTGLFSSLRAPRPVAEPAAGGATVSASGGA